MQSQDPFPTRTSRSNGMPARRWMVPIRCVPVQIRQPGAMSTRSPITIQELPLLTESERHQIAVEWNATGSDYPCESLAELFAEQAARAPERTAWEHGREELSYGELDRRSNQVARFLLRRGVKPGDLVALQMERSAALVAAMVGIVKSGAAYLPLDPAYPEERRALMLADSGSSLIPWRPSTIGSGRLDSVCAPSACRALRRSRWATSSKPPVSSRTSRCWALILAPCASASSRSAG